MKKIVWRKCQKIFLEAIFSHSRKLVSKLPDKIFVLIVLHDYHWRRKFSIVFQPVIIQNYDA